jgi:hypothetical protein
VEQSTRSGQLAIAAKLDKIMPLLWRKPPARPKAKARPPLTNEEIARVKKALRENPDASMFMIAQNSGVDNQGRVSEIASGKRG